MFFFFFSSRRRHTRYWRDWSSDVCSSDLPCGDITSERGQRPREAQATAGLYDPQSGGGAVCRCPVCCPVGLSGPGMRWADRKSVVEGKSVDLGGRRIIKKKKR